MRKFKHQTNTRIHWRLAAFALCAGALLNSCKKTEVVAYEAEPANHIVEYKVTNAAEALYGVVDDIENTITVYVPYYLNIDYIVPEITLDEGASLIDKEGNEIDIREDLEPVPFDSVGYTYRIKDGKNDIRLYTLVTKVIPYKDALKLGYSLNYVDGIGLVDDEATLEAAVNSRISIYGNLASSSKNAKLSLISKKTNTIVPNGIKLYDISSGSYFYTLTADISAEVDSGSYYIAIEHQGRRDTLPSIHLAYQKPSFEWLGKAYAAGDVVTLNVGINAGVNMGIKRAYAMFKKVWFDFPGTTKPANFPESLFDVPIELEIVSQTRTQIQFKFPDVPVGYYSIYISSGSGVINDSGFGFYFDFNDSQWGNDNLLSTIPYTFDVTAKP